MDRPRRSVYPAAAPQWLVGDQPVRVLDLGSGSGSFAQLLADAGHDVFGIDRDASAVAALMHRLGTLRHVVGQVEALPYLACHFDVVTAAETMHRFAPGLALAEIARVLKPGGHLAVVYNTRDATVPWVRRLIALLQQGDSHFISSDPGQDTISSVVDSPFFGAVEQRSFRYWVPTTRSGLVAMVDRRPATQRLAADERENLLREVGVLYDSSARPPEPLMLPFRATCWRAAADHSQLAAVDTDFDVLEIRL